MAAGHRRRPDWVDRAADALRLFIGLADEVVRLIREIGRI
jgi:hypothetical protein